MASPLRKLPISNVTTEGKLAKRRHSWVSSRLRDVVSTRPDQILSPLFVSDVYLIVGPNLKFSRKSEGMGER